MSKLNLTISRAHCIHFRRSLCRLKAENQDFSSVQVLDSDDPRRWPKIRPQDPPDGRTDTRTNARTDGRTDGRTDARTFFGTLFYPSGAQRLLVKSRFPFQSRVPKKGHFNMICFLIRSMLFNILITVRPAYPCRGSCRPIPGCVHSCAFDCRGGGALPSGTQRLWGLREAGNAGGGRLQGGAKAAGPSTVKVFILHTFLLKVKEIFCRKVCKNGM